VTEKPIILIIDDEDAMRDSCSMILTKDGFRAETAENGQVGLEKVRELKPALALIDLKMPGLSGLQVLEKIRDIDPQIIPIVITGYATVESAVEAMKKGAYDFLPKPFAPEELRIIIRRALERRKLAQEAETLRREKKIMEENFITMVSHQLRSPLVAIQQYFEVILAGMVGRVDDAQKEMIVRARVRLESLLQLINDWLDMARITRGQIVDKLVPLALEKLLDEQVEFMKPSAQEHKVRLEFRPPERPALVLGDKQSLEQLFSNLISNAIKYNQPEGSIIITVREEDGTVLAEVADTGIGIAREQLPFIFDQFYRVSRREDQKTKGTGLGLAIAKKIVEAHNGSIRVTSEPGRGSTFSVRLPKAEPAGK
jgi:two-component system sensor histidine kinase/response regulator